MTLPRALVVDDEPHIRELLSITLARMDVQAVCAENLERAYELLKGEPVALCLTDMHLPDGSGLDLVRYVSRDFPDLPVAVITAHGDVSSAVEALKAGAFDFVNKPVDLPVLRALVTTALRLAYSRRDTARTLIGNSAQMRDVRSMIIKLARSQAPVFISGESGTGKELAARMIHDQGPRADGAFVPVNCGAIPSELLESELFGHRKGAFTGAVADKAGLFQAAEGGTLFLDEVAEMPLATQVKLLRAIQEKRVRPVGAEQEVVVDARILSASHQDLVQLVRDGVFREDLYYRLDVITLDIPPLRARREDVEILVAHVLERLCGSRNMQVPKLSDEAWMALRQHAFPGNVRELENLLERALALCEFDTLSVADLGLQQAAPRANPGLAPNLSPGAAPHHVPAGLAPSSTSTARTSSAVAGGDSSRESFELDGPLDAVLETVERRTILRALEQVRWNKTRAAKRLGISFGALRYRMQKLDLD
ncbi:MAG: two-component system response regulator PilR (NtrC family) [Gammaproteobacteria bacterium]